MSYADEGPLFLGLDLSTQQLKAILISDDSSVVHQTSVGFDKDLPHYGTTNGAILGPDEGEVTSPVEMWLEALDLLMQRMKDEGVDFSAIQGISGAGQQHGSVYWSATAETALGSLDSAKPLQSQLIPDAFSLPNAPIWQDSSTTRECRELEDAIGGAQALADVSGSRAYERFTGTQIKRVCGLRCSARRSAECLSADPASETGGIQGDVPRLAGLVVLAIAFPWIRRACKWDDRLLEACGGPELRPKIGPEPVPGGSILGKVSKWWIERWGFSPDCIVAPFTGDNPATMVALSTPGDAVLSLGTSTTFLLSIPPAEVPPARFTTSHLLSHPTTIDAQIAMLCYKNGALAREQVRNKYANADWAKFNALVEGTPAGNDAHWGFYFPLPEIIPPNVRGDFFFSSEGGAPVRAASIPDAAHPRAILESQFLSIRSRIAAIMPSSAPMLKRLVLTGGSSANQTIRQLAADLFGMSAFVVEDTKEAAGTGGAILAKFAWWRAMNGGRGTFEEMRASDAEKMKKVAEPREEITRIYDQLVEPYRLCEAQVVQACAN